MHARSHTAKRGENTKTAVGLHTNRKFMGSGVCLSLGSEFLSPTVFLAVADHQKQRVQHLYTAALDYLALLVI